jgi:hypothetical protein
MDENKAVLEAFASLAEDESQRDALAEFIVEWIQPNHYTSEIMNLMLDTRSLNLGDALTKRVRKGIEVRTLVPGSVHLASEITVQDVANYMLDGADVKVHANLWDLENGEIGTVGEIRQEMLAKLTDFYITRVYNALTNVWNSTNTPNNYAEGASLTSTLLKDAIEEVSYRTGGVRAVVGVKHSLLPITEFGGFWDDGADYWRGLDPQLQEIMRTGFLGRWYGAPIVGLQQLWKSPIDYTKTLPEDKILVVGESVGEFITYGPTREKQWNHMDPTPPWWVLEIYQQFGMIIDNAQGIYVIKLTG